MNMTIRGVLHTYVTILLIASSGLTMADGGRERKAKEDAFRTKLRGGVSSEVTNVAPVFPGAKLQLDNSARNLVWIFEVPASADARVKQHYANNKPSLVHGAVELETNSTSTIIRYKIYSTEAVAKRQALMNEIKANPPTEDFMGAPLLEGMTYNIHRTFLLSVDHKQGEWIRSFDYAFDKQEFEKAFLEKTGTPWHRYRMDINPVRAETYKDNYDPKKQQVVEYYVSSENATKIKPFAVAKADFDAKKQAGNQPRPAAVARPSAPAAVPDSNQSIANANSDPSQQPQQQAPTINPANVFNGLNQLKGLFGR